MMPSASPGAGLDEVVAQHRPHLGLQDQVELVGDGGVGVGGVVLHGPVDLHGEHPHDPRVVGVHGALRLDGEERPLAGAGAPRSTVSWSVEP